MSEISSTNNPTIKYLHKLIQKSKERKKEKKFVVEGRQENKYALEYSFRPIAFYIQSDIYNAELLLPDVPVYQVSEKVYHKLAYRKTTEGIIGLYHTKENKVDLSADGIVLVLDGIEKPGNLGAILRSSLAFGVNMIFLSDSKIDLYNPNVIRSSVGTIFSIPIVSDTSSNIYSLLKTNGFTIYGTDMHSEAKKLNEVLFAEKSALLFGTEHSGISNIWKHNTDENFLITTQNNIDSLNLSNAVAISLYAYQIKKAKR